MKFASLFGSPKEIINQVEVDMDPTLNGVEKKIEIKHLGEGENIPEEPKTKTENPPINSVEEIVEYRVPKKVLDYFETLMRHHSNLVGPLRILQHEISYAISIEDVVKKIENCDEGLLDDKEKTHIRVLLGSEKKPELDILPKNVVDILGVDNSEKKEKTEPEQVVVEKIPIKSESSPKVERNIYIDESELVGAYNYTVQKFSNNPFTIMDFAASDGLGSLTQEQELGLLKIFDILIQRGKLKKEGDKYAAILEEQVATEPSSESVDQRELAVDIENAQSFEELYGVLRKAGGIQDSGAYYNAEDLIKNINVFRKSEGQISILVTRQGGLREKIRKLLIEEIQNKTNSVDIDGGPQTPEPIAFQNIKEVVLPAISTPSTQEVTPILTPEQIAEQIKENLKNSKEKYALAQINYKKKNLENHKYLAKIRAGLGMTETTAEVLGKITPKNIEGEIKELGLAQTEYISAKKAKMMEILSVPVTLEEIKKLGIDESLPEAKKIQAVNKFRAIEQAETEWKSLQNKIVELTPVQEKGKIMKILESWSKKSLLVRLTALPILIGVAIALAPGLGFAAGGITAGVAYTGVRAARGVGGYFGAKYAGKGFDSVMENKNIKTHETHTQNYGEILNEGNFDALEKLDMENREREVKSKQQQKIAKAMVMMGAGAGTGILTGLAESATLNAVIPGVGHVEVPSAPTTQSTGFFQSIKNRFVDQEGPSTPKAPGLLKDMNYKTGMLKADAVKIVEIENVPEVPPVKVELSSRGFIQTFDDLKGKLKAQYPDSAKMPKGVKEFIDKPSTKLAEDYGFYDAKKGLSGMGMKGEQLTIDSKGNLSLEHLKGKSPEIIDTTDHKFNNIGGRMFAPKVPVPEAHNVADLPNTGATKVLPWEGPDQPAETSFGTPESPSGVDVPYNGPTKVFPWEGSNQPPEIPISSHGNLNLPSYLKAFDLGASHVSYQSIPGTNATDMIYELGKVKVSIAHYTPTPDGKSGTLSLLPKYQDGNINAPIREAFVKAQESVLNNSAPLGKTVESIDFEKGKIHVVRGVMDNGSENPNLVKVMLNGKEIAKGLVGGKGTPIKILDNAPHHSGFMKMFMGDTVYERALKVASKTIKAFKIVK